MQCGGGCYLEGHWSPRAGWSCHGRPWGYPRIGAELAQQKCPHPRPSNQSATIPTGGHSCLLYLKQLARASVLQSSHCALTPVSDTQCETYWLSVGVCLTLVWQWSGGTLGHSTLLHKPKAACCVDVLTSPQHSWAGTRQVLEGGSNLQTRSVGDGSEVARLGGHTQLDRPFKGPGWCLSSLPHAQPDLGVSAAPPAGTKELTQASEDSKTQHGAFSQAS